MKCLLEIDFLNKMDVDGIFASANDVSSAIKQSIDYLADKFGKRFLSLNMDELYEDLLLNPELGLSAKGLDKRLLKNMFDTAFSNKIMEDEVLFENITEEEFTSPLDTRVEDKTSFEDLMMSAFQNFGNKHLEMAQKFHNSFYHNFMVDLVKGKLMNLENEEEVHNKIASLKETLKNAVDQETLYDMQMLSDLDQELVDNPVLMDTYIDSIIANNFDLLLNHYYGSFIRKDGEIYRFKSGTRIAEGWQTKNDFKDSFEEIADTITAHLNSMQPVIKKEIENEDGTFQDTFVPVGGPISKSQFKRFVTGNNKFTQAETTVEDIANIFEELSNESPVAQAIYNRFFAKEKVMVEGTPVHSFAMIAEKPLINTAPKDDQGNPINPDNYVTYTERRMADNHIAALVSAVINIGKDTFVSLNKKGQIEKTNHESYSFGSLITDMEAVTTHSGDVKYLRNLDDGRVRILNHIIEVKGVPAGSTKFEATSWENEAEWDVALEDMLETVGINVKNVGVKTFLSSVKEKMGVQGLVDLIVNNARVLALNNDLKEGADPETLVDRLVDWGYTEETANDTVYSDVEKRTVRNAIVPHKTNSTLLKQFLNFAEQVQETVSSDVTKNSEGENVAKYSKNNVLKVLDSRMKQVSQAGSNSVLSTNMLMAPRKHSGMTGPAMRILDWAVKDGFYDEQNATSSPIKNILDPMKLFAVNFQLYVASINDSEGSSAYMDYMVPSDKPRTFVPKVSFGRDVVAMKNGKFDRESYRNDYFEFVRGSLLNKEQDIIKAWTNFFNEVGITVETPSTLIELQNILDKRDDIIQSLLESTENFTNEEGIKLLSRVNTTAPTKEQASEKGFDITRYYKESKVLDELIASSDLVNNHDYIFTENKRLELRQDLISMVAIHKDAGLLNTFLTNKRKEFVSQASTTFDSLSKSQKETIKKSGFSKEVLLESYFWNNLIASTQVLDMTQGSVFSYKPSKKNNELRALREELTANSNQNTVKNSLTNHFFNLSESALHGSFIDLTKRSVEVVSAIHRATLQAKDPVTGLPRIGQAYRLPEESNIAYFNDIKEARTMFGDAFSSDQEVMDGAFFLSPLELIKTVNSYGGSLSGMESEILKDFTSNFNILRGIPSLEKKASFQMTIEWMKNSRGSRFDMEAIHKRMLSSVSFSPLIKTVLYGDTGTEVSLDGRYETMSQLVRDIKSQGGDLSHFTELYTSPAYNTDHTEDGETESFHNYFNLTDQDTLDVLQTITSNEEAFTNYSLEPEKEAILRPLVRYAPSEGDNQIGDIFVSYPANMYEVFDLLGGTDRKTHNGIYDDQKSIWKAMLDVEADNPQIANQYISKIGINTSVKSGARKVNPDLYSVVRGEKELIYDKVSNKHSGIQLNPDHDPYLTDDALSMVTQKLAAFVYEGREDKASKVFEAIKKISEHSFAKTYGDEMSMIQDSIKSLLSSDRVSEDLKTALTDPEWDLSDPSLYPQLSTMLLANANKASIKHKFNGGQFVVTPTNGIIMLYDVDGKSMLRADYEQYMKDTYGLDPNKTKIFRYKSTYLSEEQYANMAFQGNVDLEYSENDEVKPRDLKWNQYYKETSEGKVMLEDDPLYNDYMDSYAFYKKTVKEYQEFNEEVLDTDTSAMDKEQRTAFDFVNNKKREELTNLTKETYQDFINVRAALQAELKSGAWNSTPAEIILPFTFKKYFNGHFKDNRAIDISEVEVNELYFYDVVKKRFSMEGKKAYKSVRDASTEISYAEIEAIAKDLRESFLKTLTGDSMRVPMDAMHSGNNYRVAGFLESLSNSIGIPIESMIQKGEDLDIDKSFLQMYELLYTNKEGRASSKRGMLAPYFVRDQQTGEVIKNGGSKGSVMSESEVMEEYEKGENKELVRTVDEMNAEFSEDWLLKGLKNYTLDLSIEMFSHPANAMEITSSVNTDTFETKAKENESKRPPYVLSPYKPLSKEYMANAVRSGASMIGIAAVAIKGYSAVYQTARMFGSEFAEPISFNGKVYKGIANSDDADINSFVQAWKSLGEELNAAADNAKLLYLGKLNLSPDSSSIFNYLVIRGVPLKQALNFMVHPAVEDYINYTSDKKSYTPEDAKAIKSNLQASQGEQILDIFEMADSFTKLSNLLSINQGMKTDPASLHNYLQQIKEYDEGNTYNYLSGREYNEPVAGNPFDAINMLKANPHFEGFMKAAIKAYDVLTNNYKSLEMTDKMMGISRNTSKKKEYYNHVRLVADKVLTDQYISKQRIEINGKKLKLNSLVDRKIFIDQMGQYLAYLKKTKYPNNSFIKAIRESRSYIGPDNHFTVHKINGLRNMSEDHVLSLRMTANRIGPKDQKILYLYDLLMNNATGVNSYSSLFNNEVKKAFNRSIKNVDVDTLDLQELERHADLTFMDNYVEVSRSQYEIEQGDDAETVEEKKEAYRNKVKANRKVRLTEDVINFETNEMEVVNRTAAITDTSVPFAERRLPDTYDFKKIEESMKIGIPFTMIDGKLHSLAMNNATDIPDSSPNPASNIGDVYLERISENEPVLRQNTQNVHGKIVEFGSRGIGEVLPGQSQTATIATSTAVVARSLKDGIKPNQHLNIGNMVVRVIDVKSQTEKVPSKGVEITKQIVSVMVPGNKAPMEISLYSKRDYEIAGEDHIALGDYVYNPTGKDSPGVLGINVFLNGVLDASALTKNSYGFISQATRPAPELVELSAAKKFVVQPGTKMSVQETFKAQMKSMLATKFIGKGNKNSAIALFESQAGSLANSGSYTSSDVVWATAEPSSQDRLPLNIEELKKAMQAGATIIQEAREDITVYDKGEKDLYDFMANDPDYRYFEMPYNGKLKAKYPNAKVGVWVKQNDGKAYMENAHNTVMLDENAIYEQYPTIEERNQALGNFYKNFGGDNLYVKTDKFYPRGDENYRENKGEISGFRISSVEKSGVSPIMTHQGLHKLFKHIVGLSNVEVKTQGEIDEIKTIPDHQSQNPVVKDLDNSEKIYINSSQLSLDTPLAELSPIWLEVIKNSDPSLLQSIVNVPLSEDIKDDLLEEGYSLPEANERVIPELLKRGVFSTGGTKADKSELVSTVSRYMNKIESLTGVNAGLPLGYAFYLLRDKMKFNETQLDNLENLYGTPDFTKAVNNAADYHQENNNTDLNNCQ